MSVETTSSPTETKATGKPVPELGGKYLTFFLGQETYGIQITKIQEIIRMQNVTRVPRVKEFVRGVINLRGKIIPVMELRLKFGLSQQEDSDKTCIIVLQVANQNDSYTIGVIIDEVKEVLNIASEAIDPPSMIDETDQEDFILGLGKVGDDVKILLNVDKLLSPSELSVFNKL